MILKSVKRVELSTKFVSAVWKIQTLQMIQQNTNVYVARTYYELPETVSGNCHDNAEKKIIAALKEMYKFAIHVIKKFILLSRKVFATMNTWIFGKKSM